MKKKPSKNNKPGSLRVIAGQWRGRKIPFSETEGLRPTSDRVRETLFNWLQPEINTMCCLDLFAGSGALGVEALSRGAPKVSFVELNSQNAKRISELLDKLQSENAEVINLDAEHYLASGVLEQFQLIFLDPPYKKFTLEQLSKLLEKSFQQKQNCKIFYEYDQEIEENSLPANWSIEKQKKAGRVYFYLLNRQPA